MGLNPGNFPLPVQLFRHPPSRGISLDARSPLLSLQELCPQERGVLGAFFPTAATGTNEFWNFIDFVLRVTQIHSLVFGRE